MNKSLLLVAGLLSLTAHAAPFLPQTGSQVIETLPRRSAPAQQELQRMRGRLSAAPDDIKLAADLAQRYIALGRSETDPRYFGYAQAALSPWWSQPAPPPEVRLLRATLLQNSHRFELALADLDAVTRADPNNAQAWLTRATVQTVQGDYTGATASCARLSNLANQLVSIACLSNVAGITGRLAGSERLLDATLERSGEVAPELQSWVLTLLAEMATRRGDAALAEARFRRALSVSPRDSYLLGAYADFLLDQRRPADVVRLLKDQGRIDALLLRYALALAQLGGMPRELAAANQELKARFDAAAQRGDSVHRREEARYALHLRYDAGAALALAKQNWQVQKEPADVRILLEAALAAKDKSTVNMVLDWTGKVSLEDAALAALARQAGREL
ncbi:MAG: hypothetical protein V4724_39250 [Pseudomonadota bacterium]